MTKSLNVKEELDLVFGSKSVGDTLEERVQTSNKQFVRSQIQLAPYSDEATGRVLSAREAFYTFGWQTLLRAVVEGSVPLIKSPREPADTLRTRREELGITEKNLAKRVGISIETLKRAETPGEKNPYRTLESLAQALALDERVLGLEPNARKDTGLGVRLRQMGEKGGSFTANTVLQLSEAAWIIARQADLQSMLEDIENAKKVHVKMPEHDSSFSYPTFEVGYRLAEKTRELLGLKSEEPIESVRKAIEDDFDLPLIQVQMDEKLAGATIANGKVRGIVVNEKGWNINVWVRRMTLCHELGHLLWDPEANLQQIKVDAYTELERNNNKIKERDPSEIRANAFAVALLAPPNEVRSIASRKNANPKSIVSEVMSRFGISASAAKQHVKNVTNIDVDLNLTDLPEPEDYWIALENLTIDYFPIQEVPISRRGKFAWCVAKAWEVGEISLDSAASLLALSANSVSDDALRKLLSLQE
ncbi:MAG: ImmA/IrrE family metallo-endopeptidase [Azovibrio sp.]